MARQSVSLPQPLSFRTWQEWGVAMARSVGESLNRTQKVDEELELPRSTPTSGSRFFIHDTNGVRYAVTVSTAGALVVTAAPV